MNLNTKSVVMFFASALLALPAANANSHRLAPGEGGAEIGLTSASCPKSGCQAAGQTFYVSVPKSGDGTFYFTNDSGARWSTLQLTETGVPASDINCLQNLFVNCSVSTVNGVTTILLSGVNSRFGGIGSGQTFVLGVDCNRCSDSHNGLNISGKGNVQVPEAGSFDMLLAVLFLGLICAIAYWRNRDELIAANARR